MRLPVGANTPEHIVYAGQYSGLGIIVNYSLTDTIIVGPDPSSCYLDQTGSIAPDAFQVGPLNYLGVDGKFDYWALNIGNLSGGPTTGIAEVQYQPGATSWAPSPIQAAQQIAVTGTILNVAIPPTGNVVIPGGQAFTKTVPVTQIGYEIAFSLVSSQGAAVHSVNIVMEWMTAASGQDVKKQVWNILAGNVGAPHFILGTGPTAGDQVKFTVTNNSATNACTMTLTLVESGHTYTAHDWRTDAYPAHPFNLAGPTAEIQHDAQAGILGQIIAQPLAANGRFTVMLPLYSGPASVWTFSDSVAANAVSGYINNEADLFNTSPSNVIAAIPGPPYEAGGANLAGIVNFPRSQCSLRIDNETGSAVNIYAGLTAGLT